MMKLAIVGTGGSGGWFCQLLAKSDLNEKHIMLIDGDVWTKSNLTRQFCTKRDLGKPKVALFAKMLTESNATVLECPAYLNYKGYAYDTLVAEEEDVCIFVAVDNHPARRLVYHIADERKVEHNRNTIVISVANEYEDASAWVYLPEWKDTYLDPRVRWPEIMTDDEGDPLRPPCTGEVLASSPQLALANMLSASAGAWLHRFWTHVIHSYKDAPVEMQEMLKDSFPVWCDFTNGRNLTYRVKDLKLMAEQPKGEVVCQQ